jgi:predicted transcriptional regulator
MKRNVRTKENVNMPTKHTTSKSSKKQRQQQFLKHLVSKQPTRIDPWVPNLLARVFRYLAGDDNELCTPETTLHTASRLALGEIGVAVAQMIRLGWISPPERDMTAPRPGRRGAPPYTYHFTESFPAPTTAFTRHARRFIGEMLGWPGKITATDMSVLLALAELASSNREYKGDRSPLAHKTEISLAHISTILERLAQAKCIAADRNKLRFRSIRFAGPSGIIDDTKDTWPEPEYRELREQVFRYVKKHPGEDAPARKIADELKTADEIGWSTKQVRTQLYWLIDNEYIKRDPRSSRYRGNEANRYWPTRVADPTALPTVL